MQMTAKVMAPAGFCRDHFYCILHFEALSLNFTTADPRTRWKLHALESKPPDFGLTSFLTVPVYPLSSSKLSVRLASSSYPECQRRMINAGHQTEPQ
jgi:hypothetical protein